MAMVFAILSVAKNGSSEEAGTLSPDQTQFELWLQKTYDHIGIVHRTGEDKKIFVYVNGNWENGGDEWQHRALRRFGCAARTEYAGELRPPYDVEILLLVPRTGGAIITKTVAEGTIDNTSCALNDFFPILRPAKETEL